MIHKWEINRVQLSCELGKLKANAVLLSSIVYGRICLNICVLITSVEFLISHN